jgi:hypothetical protein
MFFYIPAIKRETTFTNKRKVWSVKKKVKLIQEIENGNKIADVYQEFAFVYSTIQTIWKNKKSQLLVCLKRTGREQIIFECLNEVMSVRHCRSGLSNREVLVYK